jgi:beta-1,4-N-acetylglucosaminyltransferase
MATLVPTSMVAAAAIVVPSLVLLRIIGIMRCIHSKRRKRQWRRSEERGEDASLSSMDHLQNNTDETRPLSSKFKTVVFLGSGGHTTEMIQLLQQLDHKIYAPIVYIVAKSDATSIPRLQRYILSAGATKDGDDAQSWEGRYPEYINGSNNSNDNDDATCQQKQLVDSTANTSKTIKAQVYTLPRAREVHQSYTSSIFTTIYSTYKTIRLLWTLQPHLIVTNGPGTCVPIVYCAFILRCLFSLVDLVRSGGGNSSSRILFRTIFIESLCRVKTLSLSGKLVYPIVDSFVVHWPSLVERYDMVEVCDVFVPSLES